MVMHMPVIIMYLFIMSAGASVVIRFIMSVLN